MPELSDATIAALHAAIEDLHRTIDYVREQRDDAMLSLAHERVSHAETRLQLKKMRQERDTARQLKRSSIRERGILDDQLTALQEECDQWKAKAFEMTGRLAQEMGDQEREGT